MPSHAPVKDPRPPGVSARGAAVPPFLVMEVISRVQQLEAADVPPPHKILHLEIGQPRLGPPAAAVSAAAAGLSGPRSGYTASLGMPALREAIAGLYARDYGLPSVRPDHIAVTTGASGALIAVYTAAFDHGDRVVVPSPSYPCYRHLLRALGVSVVPVPARKGSGYRPCAADIEAALQGPPRARGVMIGSPANPTGAAVSRGELGEIARVCAAADATLIVDEVYHGVSGPWQASALETVAATGARVVVIGSFSKRWRMTGMRIGWAATSDGGLMRAMERVIQNASISAPTMSQFAAVAAAEGACDGELAGDTAMYEAAARALVERLRPAGFDADMPDGAFYVWAGCEAVCARMGVKDSVRLCQVLLEIGGVACTPGLDFDEEEGGKFIRFSIAGGAAEAAEAGERIAKVVHDLSKGGSK